MGSARVSVRRRWKETKLRSPRGPHAHGERLTEREHSDAATGSVATGLHAVPGMRLQVGWLARTWTVSLSVAWARARWAGEGGQGHDRTKGAGQRLCAFEGARAGTHATLRRSVRGAREWREVRVGGECTATAK